MTRLKFAAGLLAAALALTASGSVFSHGRYYRPYPAHRHSHLGVVVGIPFGWGWTYPPAYYYPPVVAVPSAPPVYIERGDAPVSAAPDAWWYYCESSNAYYPYVRDCPGGWTKVAPTPPPR